MYFTTILLGIAASLGTIVSAAEMKILLQFNSTDCSGTRFACDAAERVCCEASPKFRSAKCQGCKNGQLHVAWSYNKKAAYPECGNQCDVQLNAKCSHCSHGTGNSWQAAPSSSKRDLVDLLGDEEFPSLTEREPSTAVQGEKSPCVSQMLPNRLSKDGHNWYRINHDVPQDVTEEILRWADNPSLGPNDVPERAKALKFDPILARRGAYKLKIEKRNLEE